MDKLPCPFALMSDTELVDIKEHISQIQENRRYEANKKDYKNTPIELHKDQEEDGKVVAIVYPKDVVLVATPTFYYEGEPSWSYSLDYKDAFYKVKGGKFTKKQVYDHYHEISRLLPDIRYNGKTYHFSEYCENMYSYKLEHSILKKELPTVYGLEVVEFNYEMRDDKGNYGAFVKDYYKDRWYLYVTIAEGAAQNQLIGTINDTYPLPKNPKKGAAVKKAAYVEYLAKLKAILNVTEFPFDTETAVWNRFIVTDPALIAKRFEFRKYFDKLERGRYD